MEILGHILFTGLADGQGEKYQEVHLVHAIRKKTKTPGGH